MSWYTMSDDQRRRAIAAANEDRVSCRDFSAVVKASRYTVRHWANKRGLRFNGVPRRQPDGPKDIERFERVKALAKDGLSSAEIARELGIKSRSAIIGLCHRHGVKLNGKPGGNNPGPRRSAKRDQRASIVRRMHAARASDVLIADVLGTDRKTVARYREQLGLALNASAASKSSPLPVNSGQALFLDVIERASGRCRWIDGDPRAVAIEQLRCCGAPVSEGSYCEYHAAVINGIVATFTSPTATRRPGGTDTATRAARSPCKQEAWTGRP